MKVVHLVGARPNFVKLAPLIGKLHPLKEVLVHSGQHYDYTMDKVFFDTLGIKEPDYHLGVGSGSHAEQTGKIMVEFERICLKEKPHLVIVYGDCNTTIAGALVAAKLHIPLCHIEAGIRSYDREMPEEINRVLTDHCSDYLFAPTMTAVKNLEQEGITKNVFNVGDIMFETYLEFMEQASASTVIERLGLSKKEFYLATLHRPSNVDFKEKLERVFRAMSQLDKPVVLPLHPRTRKRVELHKVDTGGVRLIEPQPYIDMIALEKSARLIITDSGGVQKEAYYAKTPCIVLRTTTEWPELLGNGAVLLGEDYEALGEEVVELLSQSFTFDKLFFGDGNTSNKIAKILKSKLLS
ncbi:UDP-N-acetylglucosamine 2-epimerase (non-hydrolyzing) [Candidatus Woesearchaeota archaeon]|nr:UDP-N-acetylglucosamine 2-epimerase (non-hydrolyzing) [Candidatus Woesearchaeota archaeon]RLE42907.1 MAG: UDP-N-acetylglucosamine 2-epimerase (non-hydrolyzing) [Candidatus Woesearchaeota archaeon]